MFWRIFHIFSMKITHTCYTLPEAEFSDDSQNIAYKLGRLNNCSVPLAYIVSYDFPVWELLLDSSENEKVEENPRDLSFHTVFVLPFVYISLIPGLIGKRYRPKEHCNCSDVLVCRLLAEMIAEKRKLPMFEIASSFKSVISFFLMRSTIRCVKGSRSRSIKIEDLVLVRNASAIKEI